jgi:DNA-binding transcriptional LysR family regulator
MEIQQIRAFLAVAEELHFGRAAEKLHMAQPPVSRSIQQLERELGTRLFDRSTRSVKLTGAGEALIGPATEVINAMRRASIAVHAADKGEVGRVRVAYAGASTHTLVGRLAREVRRDHPGIQIELLSQNFAQPAMDRVLTGDVDIALGRWDYIAAGIETRLLATEDLVVAVPANHRLASAGQVRMAEFKGDTFVSLPPHAGAVLNDRLRRLTHAAGFELDIVQIVPDSLTAISLVAAEVGCTLTLSSVAETVRDPHVRFLGLLDKTVTVELRMAWRQENSSPALRAVLELAERILPTPDSGSSTAETGH